MIRGWIVAVTAVSLLIAGGARASEQSKLLYSRGLVEFHADRFPQALELFNKAVADDPTDAYARYYRAVTRGRLGDLEGAISDLKAVLETQPDLHEAQLELGVALVEVRRYREAIPPLEQAQQVPDLDARASEFLGIAQLRLGDRVAARRNFERAAARDPREAVTARYYQGILDYQDGKLDDARQNFRYVVSARPDSDVGREAQAFLVKIEAAQGVRRITESYVMAGFQYDSNVVLAPNGADLKSALGISDQSDGRFIFGGGMRFTPWRTSLAELSLGYDFYQSLQFELHQFNLQDHGPSIQVSSKLGPVYASLLARYDYYLLETDSFLQQATVWPQVTVPLGDFGRTEPYFRMRRRDFKQMDYVIRDSFNYATGVDQYFYVDGPDRFVSVGYQYDEDDMVIPGARYQQSGEPFLTPSEYVDRAKGFGYYGNEVRLGGGWTLPYQVLVDGWWAYRHEVYAPQSSNRRDNENLAYLAFRKPIRDDMDVVAAYFGDFNNSSQGPFSYTRNIGSISFEMRF